MYNDYSYANAGLVANEVGHQEKVDVGIYHKCMTPGV